MIYLDNAATSWPKAPGVTEAIVDCMVNYCANPGRSGHDMALKSENTLYGCRCKVGELFGMDNPENIIFTQNATHGLNIVIKGILDETKHAVVTSMEHNSVLRPLAASGAMYDVCPVDEWGYVSAKDMEKLIKPNTALIICTLSSNICGSVQPFEKISAVASKHGIPFLLDASQGSGAIDINMKRHKIDYLVSPGHKGLLGPTGTGVLCINSQCVPGTLIEGGTGSQSKLVTQPFNLPDRFESGTVNVAGVAGLSAALDYVFDRTQADILSHELKLCTRLAENLSAIPGVRLVGYNPLKRRSSVVSVIIEGLDCLVAASMLNIDHSVAVRAGFHCAYTGHRALGTNTTGSIRFSPGPFSTIKDIDATSKAVETIALQG